MYRLLTYIPFVVQEEHQKQSKLYVNIKSEYEEQLQHKANTARSETDSQSDGGMGGDALDQLSPH